MEIRCKATNRFLLNIDIENYYNSIKKMGLNITIPLVIELPCPTCKMIEVFEVYPTCYKHIKSYKRMLTKDKNYDTI